MATPTSIEKANRFFWSATPLKAKKLGPPLGSMFGDGAYLSAWPLAGALIPVAAILIGLFLGWAHVGYDENNRIVFLYSAAILAVAVLLSQHGAGVGMWLLAGFAVGDLAWAFKWFEGEAPLIGLVGGRVLANLVFFNLVVGIPLAASGLTRTLLKLPPDGGGSAVWKMLVQASLAFGLTVLWCHSAAVLVQPVFTWSGIGPLTHGLVQIMRRFAWELAVVAAYPAAMRVLIEMAAASSASHREALAAFRRELADRPPGYSLPRAVVGVLAKATITTLILSTFFQKWSEAVIAGAAILAVLGLREFLLGYLGLGARIQSNLPMIVRFPVAAGIVCAISGTVIGMGWAQAGTFLPATISTVAGIAVYAFLMPPPSVRPAPRAAAAQR